MKIRIIGYGHVGKIMKQLFIDALIYDVNKNDNVEYSSRDEINKYDVAFICVPTPMKNNGKCDTSIVEEVIKWCKSDLIILRSTVEIGFTDLMVQKYNKKIVFQPEYYGETINHVFANPHNRTWLSFGGKNEHINLAIKAYQTVFNSNIEIYRVPAKEVEMAKYMENSFLACKVIFCNEMFDICNKLKIDYNQAREIWLADPRIGRSHTFVYENNRGFGGSCLPKDINSLAYQSKEAKVNCDFLESIIKKNKMYKK